MGRVAEKEKLVTPNPQQHIGGGIPYSRPVYETLFTRAPDGSVLPLLSTGYGIDGPGSMFSRSITRYF